MDTRNRTTVVGVFDSSDKARDAIEALKDAGFSAGDIGILMKDGGDARDMAEDTGADVATGAATGAVGGGILGGLAGWLVGIGALAIPGVGPFIAAGALGTALTGAAIGAGMGAIAGALVGMGVPKEEADWYEGEVRGGHTLVTVKAENRYDEARRILMDHGAYDIQSRGSMAGTSTTGYGTTGRTTDYSATSTDYGARTSDYSTGRWEDVSANYRSRWQQRYGTSGGRWEDYEPGYSYGWEMHNRPEYRDRSWREVEPELRRDWESRHRDKPWDRFGDAIRDAWENVTDRGERGRATMDRGERGRTTDTDKDTIRLREEQLRAEMESVRTGEVRAHKDVVEEEASMDVPVRREEVHMERRPVDRPSAKPVGTGDDPIRIPVYEERVRPEKETVVSEEVTFGKRTVEDTEHVSDTVRREKLRMDREGDFEIMGGEKFPEHEHNFQGNRCVICGATRHRRAA